MKARREADERGRWVREAAEAHQKKKKKKIAA
jgi:hypothetical protein